jgi:hypothetical protein
MSLSRLYLPNEYLWLNAAWCVVGYGACSGADAVSLRKVPDFGG